MKPYKIHIFVCLGKRCSGKSSEALLDHVKGRVKGGELDGVRVTRTGCLKVCRETDPSGGYSPVVVVYPEGVWYRNVEGMKDMDEIIEAHLEGGGVVERLLHYRIPN